MPERELPPPPRRPRAAAPAVPPTSGLSGLPAHLSRPKTVEEWQVGRDARQAQYAIDDAREAQATQAAQHTQARAQADQAVRDQSLEPMGWRPSGFAGALDTAGQMLGAAGHGIAQTFDTAVAGARTIGLGAMSAAANAPGYPAIPPRGQQIPEGTVLPQAPRLDFNSGANREITQRFIDAAQGHGDAIAAMPSPTAQVIGHAAEIGGNVGLGIANPFLAGASAAGAASDAGYSDAGAGFVGAVSALPIGGKGLGALAGRALPRAMRSPGMENAVGQGLIGGVTPGLINAETQMFESPELAAQTQANLGQDTLLSGGMGFGLGALESMVTRGRGAFVPPPRPSQAPPSIAAPRPDIQPEFRATTVSADPVLTEGYGNVNLPQIVRGEFAQTGSRPTVGPDGLPLGNPGEFTPTGLRPTVGPDGLPTINRGELVQTAELPGEGFYKAESAPPTPEGFNQFDAAPPTPEGFYRAQPRRPDIQPQRNDPTSLGEAAIIHPTEVGDTSPVEVPPSWELPGKFDSRPGRPQANDPFGDNIDARANAPSEVDLTPVEPTRPDPFAEYNDEPEKLGALGRMDKSLPETELQLDPVAQRAEQATDRVAPVRENVRPEYGSGTTRVDLPITPAKPGLRHLSPEAQKFVAEVKPGERELLRESVEYFKAHPDPAGDTGNLKMVLDMARAKRDKKPGARPKTVAPDEGAPVPRPTSSRAEADLVQGGFRRQGEPTPKPVDVNAPTERITKPIAETPKTPTTPGRFGLRPPDNSRQGSLNVSDPLEALGKGIAKVGSKAAAPTIGAAKIAVATAKAIDKPYSKPLVDVVRDMPGGKAAADKADKVLSYGKELVGKFSTRALAATKAITKGPRAKAARASLDEVDYRGSLGFARIHEVLDGAIPSRPAEEPFRKEMHGLTYGTGLTAERDGYTINVGDKPIPFKADPARQRVPRIGTPGLRYYAQRPDHPDTVALVKAIAADPRNAGLKPEDVFGEFKAWAERGITKRGMAEDARTIKAFPTHWRAPDGRIVQLLETDPHKLIQAVAQTFPERIAFRKHFGGGAVPKEFADLQRVSGDKGATAGENLFRALHRMRLHDGVSDLADDVLPGSAAEATRDWLNYPYQAIKEGKLSMAALPNLFETLGKTRAIGGNANYAKAFKDIVLTSSAKREAVLAELAQRGAITRDVLDWYVNKSNYAETVTRFTRNTLSAARHSVDELNERVSARTMQLWSEGLQKGKGGLLDRPKLAQMNYSPDQINAIVKGGFSDRVQADLMRRANVSAQQLRAHPAERSRLGNSPAWTNFTIGDQYAQANQNRNLRLWGEVAKAAMTPSLSHAERVKATTAALGHAVNSAGGQLAASSLTMIARAMIYGGGAVLLDKASGSPLGLEDFMQDAFKYAFIGGPAQALLNTASAENGKVTDDIVRPFLPISVLQEARDLVYSAGKYDGMGGIEGVGTFLASNLAATPMIANIAAVAGLAKDDKALDAGITAFRNWKAEYAPEARITPVASPDAFRAAMRQAGEALKDGTDPSEAIYKALGSRKRDSVAASLRGKKILPSATTPKGKAERAEALKYLGPATMHKLEMYDRMLEVWAKRINPPE